jgi:hypothetical protein
MVGHGGDGVWCGECTVFSKINLSRQREARVVMLGHVRALRASLPGVRVGRRKGKVLLKRCFIC